MAVLVYGSQGVDITYRLPRLPAAGEDLAASAIGWSVGGGGGNVAACLGAWGIPTVAGGNRLGADPLGRWAAKQLGSAGVDLLPGFWGDGGHTPVLAILVTADGGRTVIGSDYAGAVWSQVPDAVWDATEVAVVDRYSGGAGAAAVREANQRAIPVVGSDLVGESARRADVVVWSAAEHPDPDEAGRLAAAGPAVVVTAGPGPLRLHTAAARLVVEPPAVEAGDSTGAGDVIVAACAAGRLLGVELTRVIQDGAAAASAFVAAGRKEGFPAPAFLSRSGRLDP